jgi:hypothetical protein
MDLIEKPSEGLIWSSRHVVPAAALALGADSSELDRPPRATNGHP